jgi:hypothetical protein
MNMAEYIKNNKSSSSGFNEPKDGAIGELKLAIKNFKDKKISNETKIKNNLAKIELCKTDLKEMKEQAPLFDNEKIGLISQLEENYIKDLSKFCILN